jgi:hypothetical protein
MPPMTQPQAQVGGPNSAFGELRGRKKRRPQSPVIQTKRSLTITRRWNRGRHPRYDKSPENALVTAEPPPNHL